MKKNTNLHKIGLIFNIAGFFLQLVILGKLVKREHMHHKHHCQHGCGKKCCCHHGLHQHEEA
ncbi:hypothetical protein [Companilactobacillus mishanensis]|uniref:FeoB-associated Cys-rich membrane protein n=1 Tax=Companilactobacillus mishanensis TaxID=2486008 RepID=A0A5P0ZHM7_9LACO|nr:hypothetical protein [Companilactobacillus mishanensis]MQS52485.1 hypothetical protein [Companilactobacillus mishanensis]MQS89143.1 hypothetical protein [Companilactobacillus mishanensis]